MITQNQLKELSRGLIRMAYSWLPKFVWRKCDGFCLATASEKHWPIGSKRLFGELELAAGCRQNQQAGCLRYIASARFQLVSWLSLRPHGNPQESSMPALFCSIFQHFIAADVGPCHSLTFAPISIGGYQVLQLCI